MVHLKRKENVFLFIKYMLSKASNLKYNIFANITVSFPVDSLPIHHVIICPM